MTISIQYEFHLFAIEIQRYLSPSILQKLLREKSFVKRKSKYDKRDLADLCIWISQHVAFLREIFISLLTQKLCSNHSLSAHIISTFNRIRILDATVFQLPGQFATDYQGSGGSSNKADVKIQLGYDLLSSQFIYAQLGSGKNNEKTYGTICFETVEAGNLCLLSHGYFDLGDLQTVQVKEAYYILRLKLNTRIYIKNPDPEYFNNGTLKKQTEYIQLDMTQMMSYLIPGETIEIHEAYIVQNQTCHYPSFSR